MEIYPNSSKTLPRNRKIVQKNKQNSIIDKIHSIQDTMNNNNKGYMYEKRRNVFQRMHENTQENENYLKIKRKSRTKSKPKTYSKCALSKISDHSKKINKPSININNYSKVQNQEKHKNLEIEQSKNSNNNKSFESKTIEPNRDRLKRRTPNLYNSNKHNINNNRNIIINHKTNNNSKLNINNINHSNNNSKQKLKNDKEDLDNENNNTSSNVHKHINYNQEREFSDNNLSSKNSRYQENILNKKKQLGVYSPIFILKTNFEAVSPIITENNSKIDNNKNNINNINFDTATNTNNNKETNTNSNITEVTNNTKINNPQVSTIISTINRIKYTKQIYNNRKKLFNESKLRQKKQKYFNKISAYDSGLYTRHSYSKSRLRKNIVNEIYGYKRSNSKNVMSNKGKNINNNFLNFNKSKKNMKNESFEVMNVENLNNSFSNNNKLLLSYQKNRNKNNIYKHKEKSFNNIKEGTKSLNTSFNLNNKTYIKNNSKEFSLSMNSINSIDHIENNTEVHDEEKNNYYNEINKHCDNLLSKIRNNNKTIINQNNTTSKKQTQIKQNDITKKLLSNSSVCRKGLNRPDEPLKINQDNLFKIKFGDINYSFYGVCDGHGPNGHYVSEYVKSNLPFIVYKLLKTQLTKNNTLNSLIDPNINFFIKNLFSESFNIMQSKLDLNSEIDQELSGTTCVSILFCNNKIISSNVGDSRAILGNFNNKNKNWTYKILTRDHKPNLKDESERIYSCSGIVHPFIDDEGNFLGPNRVWQVNDELPGLAMSRSIGDKIAKSVGVICEPEVKIFDYEFGDKFVIIASDGLWEYVNNEEVLDIVSFFYEVKDCDGAVSKLYEMAHDRWVKYDEYIDDISIIVVFLE